MKKQIKLCDYIKYVDEETKQIIKSSMANIDNEITENAVIERRSGMDIEAVNENTYISDGYASTRKLDFSGDIMIPSGIDLSVFKKNPIIFFNHFQSALPIGKAIDVYADDYGLLVSIKYAVEENKEAETIYKLVKGKYIRQHSVGFLPLEAYKKGSPKYKRLNDELVMKYPEYVSNSAERIITKSLLLEISVVGIADNQASEIMNVKGITQVDIEKLNKFGLNLVDNIQETKEIDVVLEPVVEDTYISIPKSITLISSPTSEVECSISPIDKQQKKEIEFIKFVGKDREEKYIEAKTFNDYTKRGKLLRI